MTLRKHAPLLWRVFAFLSLFIILSGFIGPRIINNGLVGTDGFEIYGGAGKALLFSAIALVLLITKNDHAVSLNPWRLVQIAYIAGCGITGILSWLCVGKLIIGAPAIPWAAFTHILLLSSVCLGMLGVFGLTNLSKLVRKYHRELTLAIGLAVTFFLFLYIVYGLWQILATVVLHGAALLLNLSGVAATAVPPDYLILHKFGIAVSKFCSGIDSIALFTGLYVVIGIVDWTRFNHRRYLAVFVPALLILFACNIARVYLLVLAGYYINPKIAFSLFHTYAGMLFFIAYSGIFWGVSYRWMTRGLARLRKTKG